MIREGLGSVYIDRVSGGSRFPSTRYKMSTNDERQANEIFHNDREPTVLDADLASLSEENEALKDKIGEIKFLWALVVIILADFFAFEKMQSWGGPVVIGVFQLVFIFIYARMCKVDDITRLTETLFVGLDKWKGNDKRV